MTTRGFKEEEFTEIGEFISEALKNKDNEECLEQIKKKVIKLTNRF